MEINRDKKKKTNAHKKVQTKCFNETIKQDLKGRSKKKRKKDELPIGQRKKK